MIFSSFSFNYWHFYKSLYVIFRHFVIFYTFTFGQVCLQQGNVPTNTWGVPQDVANHNQMFESPMPALPPRFINQIRRGEEVQEVAADGRRTTNRVLTNCAGNLDLNPTRALLEAEKWRILRHSLSPNTFKTYLVGWRQYLTFCTQLSLDRLPLNQTILENFCISAARRVGYRTSKVYLSGVQ